MKTLTILMLIALSIMANDVWGQNHNPTASDDYKIQGENSVVIIQLMENDFDVDWNKLRVSGFYYNGNTYKVVSGGYTNLIIKDTGTVTVRSNGELTFFPYPTFCDDSKFEKLFYVLSDGSGLKDTAEVIIHYMDSVYTVPDTNGYCMYVGVTDGGYKYFPLVKRIELRKAKYYYDFGGMLIPMDRDLWIRFYKKKVKKGGLDTW